MLRRAFELADAGAAAPDRGYEAATEERIMVWVKTKSRRRPGFAETPGEPARYFCRSKVQPAPRPRLLRGSTKDRQAACARGAKTQKTSVPLFCKTKPIASYVTFGRPPASSSSTRTADMDPMSGCGKRRRNGDRLKSRSRSQGSIWLSGRDRRRIWCPDAAD